ncbi:MAG: peptidylprolyl isomerase [Pseudomonadota bacterium]
MRRYVALLVHLVAIAAAVTQVSATEIFSEKVAAVVNGEVILLSDVKRHKIPLIQDFYRGLPLGVVPPGKLPTEKEILDELIVIQLLDQDAKRKGIDVSPEELEATMKSIRTRNKLSHDQFVLFLAASGISYSEYREAMKRQLKLQKLMHTEVMKKVPMSEDDAQQYFKDHKDKIEQEFQEMVEASRPVRQETEEPKPNIPTHQTVYEGGKVRLRQIVFQIPQNAKKAQVDKIMSKATKVYEEAQMGGDFAQLTKKHSEDPSAKKTGGDLGMMDFKDLVPALQQVVRRMDVGDITPPLKTSAIVLILQVADAKGRRVKQEAIPAAVRARYLKQWEEAMEKRKAETERRKKPEKPKDKQETEEDDADAAKKAPKVKDLGILSQDEARQYEKVRDKVIAIAQSKKRRERMKDWVDRLKEESLIEVKL